MTDVTDIDTGTRPFRISLFLSGQTVEQREIEIWDLCNEALINTADRKDDLPLFSLTVFGDQRSNKSCLRHDANTLGISGVVGDYDGEQMSPQEALSVHWSTPRQAIVRTVRAGVSLRQQRAT
jgi:hypothetical protein